MKWLFLLLAATFLALRGQNALATPFFIPTTADNFVLFAADMQAIINTCDDSTAAVAVYLTYFHLWSAEAATMPSISSIANEDVTRKDLNDLEAALTNARMAFDRSEAAYASYLEAAQECLGMNTVDLVEACGTPSIANFSIAQHLPCKRLANSILNALKASNALKAQQSFQHAQLESMTASKQAKKSRSAKSLHLTPSMRH